jgi:hypothetical protein
MKYKEPLTTIKNMARLFDIRDILHLSGNKKKIVCPLPQHVHHDRTPSFSIFVSNSGVQKWVCHGNCQQSGDSVDLVGYLHISGYDKRNGQHVKEALALLSGNIRINPPSQQTTKVPTLANGWYKRYLPVGDEVLGYAASRFLTSETLVRFKIGQHKTPSAVWMTMPAIHDNQLRGIKMRNVGSRNKKDRFFQEPGSIEGLFGYNQVAGATEAVAVVKGEIPVMLLSQYGILACSPTGGETSYSNHEELLKPLAFASKRIVIGDNDQDPGVREKIISATKRRTEIFRATMFLPPDPYKGIDDFVNAEPEVAIPLIKEWMR